MWLLAAKTDSTVLEISYSKFDLGTTSFGIPVETSPATFLIKIRLQTEIHLQTETAFLARLPGDLYTHQNF